MPLKTLSLRLIGFLTSLLLTLGAYFLIVNPFFSLSTTLTLIFTLAIFQAACQLIFFIDVWKEVGPRWNLGIFLSTLLIIFIIVAFSLWIMHHLDANMMLSIST